MRGDDVDMNAAHLTEATTQDQSVLGCRYVPLAGLAARTAKGPLAPARRAMQQRSEDPGR